MSETPADIIEQKGGPAAVAGQLGKRPGTVRLWKHRNSLPREIWPDLIQAFDDIDLDRLMKAEREAQLRSQEPSKTCHADAIVHSTRGAAA